MTLGMTLFTAFVRPKSGEHFSRLPTKVKGHFKCLKSAGSAMDRSIINQLGVAMGGM